MSSLLNDVRSGVNLPGPRCSVAVISGLLSVDERADLDALLADPSTQLTRLSRALRARGHRVADSTLSRHRRGDCACEVRE